MKILPLIISFLYVLTPISADELNLPKFPKEPKLLKSFIPKSWSVLGQAEGDLNNDSIPDKVIVLKHKSESKSKSEPPYRLLLVLLGTTKEKFQLATYTNRAIMKWNDGGVSGDPFIGVNINKNSLVIEHMGGNKLRWGTTHTFQFRNDDFYLLLKTRTEIRMNSRQSLEIKTNFATGKVLRKETSPEGVEKTRAYNEIRKPFIKLSEFKPGD